VRERHASNSLDFGYLEDPMITRSIRLVQR
jgi:hypothetical protein